MAGDWIKLQKDTPDKPEVLAMASKLGLDSDAIVGKLVRVWCWFDTHTVDGNALSVTYSFLDRLSGVTGFAEQMESVGWLTQSDHVLSLPNFDYHTGNTAKRRALTKNRVENVRSNVQSVTKALPEKRREEKIKNTSNTAPPDGVALPVWQDFLKTRKTKITDTALNGIRREAEKAGITLETALQTCCTRGWQSFRADWAGVESNQTSLNGIIPGAI